jgi:hypothetical protein
MILDSRTLQSTPESGARAGYDGAKLRKGSKVHAAVDTPGHLLALHVTAADQQDRAQVERLAAEVQRITEESVELAYVDQGYTGEADIQAASQHGIQSIGGCPVADDFGVGCVAVHVVGLQQQFEIRQGTV